MKATIYCEPTSKGMHSFYLIASGTEYYLFSQDYRKGVHEYFGKGVRIDKATDFSKSRRDAAIMRTMTKIPMYTDTLRRNMELKYWSGPKERIGAALTDLKQCALNFERKTR